MFPSSRKDPHKIGGPTNFYKGRTITDSNIKEHSLPKFYRFKITPFYMSWDGNCQIKTTHEIFTFGTFLTSEKALEETFYKS